MFTKNHKLNKIVVSVLTIMLIVVFLLSMMPSMNVMAASSLDLYTKFPSVAVKPGEKVTTEIKVGNNTGEPLTVDLEVLSVPEGWDAYIEGDGKIIQKVHVDKYFETVQLKFTVPNDITDGQYKVVVGGVAGSLSDNLTLEYNIKSDLDNKGKLETNYRELKGSSDASFKFQIDINNNKSEEQTFSLGADVERGWQVKFITKYDNKQVASVNVEAGKSSSLEVEVKPPSKVNAGEYVIPVVAESASETLTTELKVIITGSYEMELTTPTGRLNAETVAGKEKPVELVVKNTGGSDLQGVKFSSWQPDGWTVSFEKDEIDFIPVGEEVTVKAYIKPDEKAIAGDYVVSISADTPEVSKSTELRVLVKTSTIWGIVGVIVIIVLVGGLYWTFNTYGRR